MPKSGEWTGLLNASHVVRRSLVWLAVVALVGWLPGSPAAGSALDADSDGHLDLIEDHLGSDPGDPASTPEHHALQGSCIDQADNDGDGAVDGADPGCRPPPVFTDAFPPAGLDIFDSTMSLDGFDLALPGGGICPIDLEARGPVVVRRGDPIGPTIEVEIVAMQLTGIGTLHPLSPCNPAPDPLHLPLKVFEDPGQPSVGQIQSLEPLTDFPAESFFDVFFVIESPLGPLPGGPPGGPPGAPLQVHNVIKSIAPYHSPGNPALNPNCYSVAGLPHQHCPKPPLDHFKCYSGKFSAFNKRGVFLRDQFLQTQALVVRPELFCNPVDKNQEGIFDEGAHLKLYRLQSPDADRAAGTRVLVRNQFGPQELVIEQLVALAVPTQKDNLPPPLALDHYACYRTEGPEIKAPALLRDQFDVEQVRVIKAQLLCNPVEKTTAPGQVTPIGDRDAHLVCYRIVPPKKVSRVVFTRNQFGEERIEIQKPVFLCAPSAKVVLDGHDDQHR